MSNYVFSTTINQPIDDAIETLKATLMNHHLGIVKTKLEQDMPAYRILGACNPKMAKTMIDAEPSAGALLPCTIVAREVDGATVFDFMDPITVLGIADNAVMDKVAAEATEKLKAAVADLEK